MKPRWFGTDGIRGPFGEPPLDEATVRRLGRALAEDLRETAGDDAHIVLGGDTRGSTPTLARWMAEGLRAGKARVTRLGTVTTPAIAFGVLHLKADCGVAISASHNPLPDNGIKLITREGFKWEPADEARLENRLGAAMECNAEDEGPGGDSGVIAAYLESLRSSVGTLDGLSIAFDAANGAASPFARELFESLGARVVMSHDSPDGNNINVDCGSTHPRSLADLVRRSDVDLGIAFDGDADRAILIDERGEIRDGDAILYLWARDLAARNALPGRRIVATSMSNLGLEVALRAEGIEVARCGVGDREVVQTMRDGGIVLGGEQSGHIVHLDLSTTGDGLLTALQLASLRMRDGRPLSQMLAPFRRFPQILLGVRVGSKPDLLSLPAVAQAVEELERKLGDEGRLVLRYSGTEPLARVMVEGPDQDEIEKLARKLAAVIEKELS